MANYPEYLILSSALCRRAKKIFLHCSQPDKTYGVTLEYQEDFHLVKLMGTVTCAISGPNGESVMLVNLIGIGLRVLSAVADFEDANQSERSHMLRLYSYIQ